MPRTSFRIVCEQSLVNCLPLNPQHFTESLSDTCCMYRPFSGNL
jgi:hypothetical protein